MSTLTQKRFLSISLAKRKSQFAIRMAPLIDIIFLLLIFFLVSANFRPQENFLPIKLSSPQQSQRTLAKPEPLEIYIFATEKGCDVRITKLHSVLINEGSINDDLVVLIEKIRLALETQKRKPDDPVEIICSDDVKWEHLTKIYNLFHGSGMTDITFRMTR